MDDVDRRDFTRIRTSVTVRYKFLSGSVRDPEFETVFEGSTINLSLGGLLLVGGIAKIDWVKDLLLDGWGIGDRGPGDARALASTPFLDGLEREWPAAQLAASGLDVGLPAGV